MRKCPDCGYEFKNFIDYCRKCGCTKGFIELGADKDGNGVFINRGSSYKKSEGANTNKNLNDVKKTSEKDKEDIYASLKKESEKKNNENTFVKNSSENVVNNSLNSTNFAERNYENINNENQVTEKRKNLLRRKIKELERMKIAYCCAQVTAIIIFIAALVIGFTSSSYDSYDNETTIYTDLSVVIHAGFGWLLFAISVIIDGFFYGMYKKTKIEIMEAETELYN